MCVIFCQFGGLTRIVLGLLSSLPHSVHRCGPGNKGSELSNTLNFIYTLLYGAFIAFIHVVSLFVPFYGLCGLC